MSTTERWRHLLQEILDGGSEVRQECRGHEPRSRTTKELIGYQSRWDMRRPLVRCPLRHLGRKFAAAEPAWILRGDNRLASILPYAGHMANFSGDGVHLSGAYGPKVVDQLPYVVKALAADPCSRQAVMTLWRERPGPDPDVPCTIALQFVVRDEMLHCVAAMRSSDAWLGVIYDILSFSCVSAAVAIALRAKHPNLVRRLGTLVLTAGSQHLYALDWGAARACADQVESDVEDVLPLRLDEFENVDKLIWHLECLSNGTVPPRRWLSELVDG